MPDPMVKFFAARSGFTMVHRMAREPRFILFFGAADHRTVLWRVLDSHTITERTTELPCYPYIHS